MSAIKKPELPSTPGNSNEAASSGRSPGGVIETARRTKTRRRLMDAAYRLFSEHGINGTSIEAVADEAGFSRGAFYSNFESKTELFFALTERENRARLEDLQGRFAMVVDTLSNTRGKPGQDVIENLIADILSAQPDNRQWVLMHSEFRLLAMRDPSVAPRFLDNDRAFQRQLAAMIDAVISSAGLRFVIDSLELTGLVIDQYESAMQEAILSDAADPDLAARERTMRTLPALIDSLTEIADPAR